MCIGQEAPATRVAGQWLKDVQCFAGSIESDQVRCETRQLFGRKVCDAFLFPFVNAFDELLASGVQWLFRRSWQDGRLSQGGHDAFKTRGELQWFRLTVRVD